MANDDRHSVAVAAVIFDEEGRLLLMKRRDHENWEPPGGVMKLNEPLDEAVRREVKEETDLDVVPLHVSGVYKNIPKDVLTVAFLCRIEGGEIATTEEATEVRWVAREEWSEYLNEDYLAWIRDARESAGVPARDQTATIKGASESPSS